MNSWVFPLDFFFLQDFIVSDESFSSPRNWLKVDWVNLDSSSEYAGIHSLDWTSANLGLWTICVAV